VKIENECLTASFIKIKQVRSRRAARPYVLAATHPRCSARPRALCTQSPPPRPPLAPSLTTFSSHPPLHTYYAPKCSHTQLQNDLTSLTDFFQGKVTARAGMITMPALRSACAGGAPPASASAASSGAGGDDDLSRMLGNHLAAQQQQQQQAAVDARFKSIVDMMQQQQQQQAAQQQQQLAAQQQQHHMMMQMVMNQRQQSSPMCRSQTRIAPP
jgi:hypothetical protein